MKDKLVKKRSIRQVRIFSQKVKEDTVKDIERGKCTVIEASRELQVLPQTIYNWIYKYSLYLSKNKVLIVEDKSEVSKTKELEKSTLDRMHQWLNVHQNPQTGLVVSFEGDRNHRYTAFTYDQSLATQAYILFGDYDKARRVIDFYREHHLSGQARKL